MTDDTHLSASQVAAYLDRTIGADERAAIDAHLASCDRCRYELIEVGRLTRSVPRRRWVTWVPVGVAAAAAAAFLMLRPVGGPGSEPERGSGAEGAASVVAVAPAANATVNPDSLVFVWRKAAADAQYRLRITDRLGNIVWTVSQPETSSVVPPSVVLERGRIYFWYVDALFPDGHSGSTGARPFRTAP